MKQKSNCWISHNVVEYSRLKKKKKKSTPAYKMQEFPVVCLIKIWRPAVLLSLSPQCAVGSLQPLYFSRSYLDAQKKQKQKERVSETEFFHSKPVDSLVCMWSPNVVGSFFLYCFFHLKWPKFCYYLLLWSAAAVPTPSISALAGRAIIIVVNIIVISDRRAEQGCSSLSSVIKELTEL